MLASAHLKEAILEGRTSLDSLREGFERKIYKVILEDVDWDEGRAAIFLDIPKTIFSERAKNLGILPRR
jgi:DNA-binding NtrC family response regulator